MSKQEAKHRWPKHHLYWHRADHCWDNRPYGTGVEKDEKVVKVEKVGAAATLPPITFLNKKPENPEVYYPGLKSHSAFGFGPVTPLTWRHPWFTPIPITDWPLLLDVDRVPFTAWEKRIGQ